MGLEAWVVTLLFANLESHRSLQPLVISRTSCLRPTDSQLCGVPEPTLHETTPNKIRRQWWWWCHKIARASLNSRGLSLPLLHYQMNPTPLLTIPTVRQGFPVPRPQSVSEPTTLGLGNLLSQPHPGSPLPFHKLALYHPQVTTSQSSHRACPRKAMRSLHSDTPPPSGSDATQALPF